MTYAVEIKPKGFLPVGLIEGRIASDLQNNVIAIREFVEKKNLQKQELVDIREASILQKPEILLGIVENADFQEPGIETKAIVQQQQELADSEEKNQTFELDAKFEEEPVIIPLPDAIINNDITDTINDSSLQIGGIEIEEEKQCSVSDEVVNNKNEGEGLFSSFFRIFSDTTSFSRQKEVELSKDKLIAELQRENSLLRSQIEKLQKDKS